jgi:hypothetical protein
LQRKHLSAGVGNETLQFAKAPGPTEQVIPNPQPQSPTDADDASRTPGASLFCHPHTPF